MKTFLSAFLACAFFCLCGSSTDAGPLAKRRQARVAVYTPVVSVQTTQTTKTTTTTTTSVSALDEVNACRAARGLRPLIHDALLTEAAVACASYRAANLISGHSANDFRFLPAGARASAAGCAAWPPHLGWGACTTYENYTYAGAASVVGRNGIVYHHIFVR